MKFFDTHAHIGLIYDDLIEQSKYSNYVLINELGPDERLMKIATKTEMKFCIVLF